jgi:hypothetical protein
MADRKFMNLSPKILSIVGKTWLSDMRTTGNPYLPMITVLVLCFS